MLSAIAARKAAQAAKANVNSREAKNGAPTNQILREAPVASDNNLNTSSSKRKPPVSATHQSTRKKKRKALVEHRYYEVNSENLSENVTQKTHDNDGIAVESCPESSEEENVAQHAESSSYQSRRAWSPSQAILDSSGDEQVGMDDTAHSGQYQSRDAGYQYVQRLSFVPQEGVNIFPRVNMKGKAGSLAILKEQEKMAILGVYTVQVLQGAVSILGSILHSSSPFTVFAPRCSPVPILTASQIKTENRNLSEVPDNILRVLKPKDTLILFEEASTGVEGLQTVCRTFDGIFNVGSQQEDALALKGANLLTVLSPSLQSFKMPTSWEMAFNNPDFSEESFEPPVILIKGLKRTGKSTAARTLLNTLLNKYKRVALLDCDIGQTEFTPPGIVSLNIVEAPLFGPPFTHPRLTYASHFIGSTSPRNSPGHYIAAIEALIQTYRTDVANILPENDINYEEDPRIQDIVPLVVNTMGWTKGLGADLARRIEGIVAPTHVFSLQNEDVPHTDPPQDDFRRLYRLEPIEATTRYTAADWRTLSILSYFYSTFKGPGQRDPRSGPLEHSWDCRLPLVAQPPYVVNPSIAFNNIVLAGTGYEDVVTSEIGRVLNGAIVALIYDIAAENTRQKDDTNAAIPYVQGAQPPDPFSSSCIGLALIRGVSPSLISGNANSASSSESGQDHLLHLLTPLPPETITDSSARCLVKGEIELPVWGMLDHRDPDLGRTPKQDVPYLQWARKDMAGADPRRVRRNLMRKGQM